jgi:hypothetical protein
MMPYLGGKKVPSTTTTAEAQVQRLAEDLAKAHMQLAMADEMLGREAEHTAALEKALRTARAEFLAGLAEAAELLLPMLRPGMYADDPMPADGIGWRPVDGDTADLPPLVGVRTELAEVAA